MPTITRRTFVVISSAALAAASLPGLARAGCHYRNDCIYCENEDGSHCKYFKEEIHTPGGSALTRGNRACRRQTKCRGFKLDPSQKKYWQKHEDAQDWCKDGTKE